MGTASGYVIFCDDIRHELQNKNSYMGVYRSELYAPEPFPYNLPKFAMSINYIEDREPPSTGPVTVKIYLPGDSDGHPSIETDLPVEDARNQPIPPIFHNIPLSERRLGITFDLILAPLTLQREGEIKVRAYRGDEEIKLRTLVVQGPPASSQSPAG